jgi:polyvinyl alcohol dehydrogenase (cytochrome)
MRSHFRLWITVAALVAALPALAQAPQALPPDKPSASGPQLSGGRPKFGPPPGMTVFMQACAACHQEQPLQIADRLAPALPTLRQLPPERLYDSMTIGKMQSQAAGLSDAQKRDIASFLTGRPMIDAEGTGLKLMKNQCSANPPLADPAASPGWSGWGNGLQNARLQSAEAAGLRAADIPKLKLKWAFGVPAAASLYSQPTIASGRVFFASDNAVLYSIDAKSGCVYWAYRADGGVRTAPIVAPITGHAGVKYAVFIAANRGVVYAVDAQTGKELWKVQPGEPRTGITGSPSFHAGRLYVPYVGSETLAGSNPKYECCTTRGAVIALDANTGKTIWKTDTIPEKLVSRGKNDIGTPLWGPAGAGVWNTPTIDPKRGLIYVGTGNAYTYPAPSTSDAILALDMKTGRILWHHQEIPGDAFMLGCADTNKPGHNCPEKIGPDWDFGGAAMILRPIGNGRDLVVAAGKAGVAVAVDPDQRGKRVWRTPLYKTPPTADGLVVFGAAADATNVYYPLQQAGGGLAAVRIATGERVWTADVKADGRGQAAPATAIPGAIFTGGWDGILRAVSTDGRVVWSYDTKRDYETVNGVAAKGGTIGSTGVAIANGIVIVGSGYVGTQNGTPGNALLAFSIQ